MGFQSRLILIRLEQFVDLRIRFTAIERVKPAPRFVRKDLRCKLHKNRFELVIFPFLNWNSGDNTDSHDVPLVFSVVYYPLFKCIGRCTIDHARAYTNRIRALALVL